MQMRMISVAIAVMVSVSVSAAQRRVHAEIEQPNWGTISEEAPNSGIYRFKVVNWPGDGKLNVPTPFPNIVRCFTVNKNKEQGGKDKEQVVDFVFNQDATSLTLLVPENRPGKIPDLIVHTSENTQQYADGRIVFSAIDATVVGSVAKLERHPGNYRIGFWTNANDYVLWNYNASRWGMYTVLMTYSTSSPDGSMIEVEMGSAKVDISLRSTGSWYRYTTIDLGNIYLAKAGKQTLSVRCTKKSGAAVMNLKAITLLPACEGTPPVQAGNGVVTLHGSDSTVHGTVLRYEHAAKKRTLGYWVRASDTAQWSFTLNTPGEYDIEVLQGCGKGQGGSDVRIVVNSKEIRFTVEDTGHFQNFKPRVVGRVKFAKPGKYDLSISPQQIAKQAAMDIRQIRLIPVDR